MTTDLLFKMLFGMRLLPRQFKEPGYQAAFKKHVNELVIPHVFSSFQILLSPGNTQDRMYFVNSGLLMAYTRNSKSGKKNVFCFWETGSFVVAPDSFFLQQPSDIYIEAMQESELLSASYQDMIAAFEKFPGVESMTRDVALQYHTFQTKRMREFLSLSAWERYLNLLKEHPGIEQKVSQDIIASYVGITPQTLSRLKGEHRRD